MSCHLCLNTKIYSNLHTVDGDSMHFLLPVSCCCTVLMLCCVLFRSMEVEGMTQISVMMMVVEGSPKMVRKGESLFYITNKNNGFWYHILGIAPP